MKQLLKISDLPQMPAVYALYGGDGQNRHVAYVGIADKLRRRVEQHLIRRDSSVTVGTSAAGLNPQYVSRVDWWEHEAFSERDMLEAAEMVASDVLEPVLRSRGRISKRARERYADPATWSRLESVFRGSPSGRLELLSLSEAVERIVALEERVTALERLIDDLSPQ